MSVNTYDKMFYKGPESALPEQTTDGAVLFTTDTGRIFLENSNDERIEISDFIKGMTEEEIKAQLAPINSKVYIASDTHRFMTYDSTQDDWTNVAVVDTDTEDIVVDITRDGFDFIATRLNGSTFSFNQQQYTGENGININGTTISNSGVRDIATGTSNGTINVNTNGTTADIAVHGLQALAYKDSLDKSDVGLSNVANLDQSKAITSITRSGTTFTATALDGSTSSFTQQDNNTTYAAGAGIALNSGTFSNSGVRSIATGSTNGTINVNTNGTTADIAVKGLAALAYKASLGKSDVGLGNVANLDQSKAIKSITRSGTTFTATAIDGTTSSFTQQDNNTTYTGANGISLSGTTFSNSGVRSIATGTSNGTINVNTNGSTANVAVKGLAALAYKASLGKSDVGLGNVANLDQSKAIKSITRSGTTFTATAIDGTTSSFTQQDNNTTYTGSNGISLSGTTFSNSGVRSIATGTSNGTINVNTNGSTANVAVKGLAALAYKASLSKSDVGLGNVANLDQSKAIKSITRSGTTFTATAIDGSTTSFTQQDNNTTYTAGTGLTLSSNQFSVSQANASAILNLLSTGDSVPSDSDWYISQYVNGGTSTTSFHRRPVSKLYDYMKGKMDNVYQVKGSYAAANHTHSYLPLSGGTLTGQILTSFKSSVAMGSYQPSATTIPDLLTELRYSSGCAGSFATTAAYTKDGVTVPANWYNFIYLPHRSGGINGSASGDNCNYGTLIFTGMTSDAGYFTIRFSSGNISSLKKLANNSDISTLQSNFQAGVDSVYNAIKAQGTTPASKSLSDVVTGIGTLSTNRYNAGTAAGYTTKRNQLTATYTPSSNGSKLDMGSNHNNRYVNTNTVYNAGTTAGYNNKRDSLTATYAPGSNGSKLDMGSNHSYRYVNTNTVYNAGTKAGYNSGTTAGYNSGTTAGYNTKVGQLTGTYTPTGSGGSKLDMGSNHNQRYVNTNTVYNAGTTAGYNTKKNQLTGTYTPTSRASKLDMGADHKYRYVNTNSVPNTNSTTYNLNRYRGLIDLGATNKYRYINANMEPIVWGDGKETSTSKKITFTATSYDSFIVVISNQTGASRTCTCSSSSVSIEEFAGSSAFCNVFLVYNSGSSDQTVTISSSAQPWTYSIMELDY